MFSNLIIKIPQKQPPKVFCKKRCSQNFRKFHRKTPVLECLFNKVATATLSTRVSITGVFLWNSRIFLKAPILKNICERLLLDITIRKTLINSSVALKVWKKSMKFLTRVCCSDIDINEIVTSDLLPISPQESLVRKCNYFFKLSSNTTKDFMKAPVVLICKFISSQCSPE